MTSRSLKIQVDENSYPVDLDSPSRGGGRPPAQEFQSLPEFNFKLAKKEEEKRALRRKSLNDAMPEIKAWVENAKNDPQVQNTIERHTSRLIHRYWAIENGKQWDCHQNAYAREFNPKTMDLDALNILELKIKGDVVYNLSKEKGQWGVIENAWELCKKIEEAKKDL